jgi:MarC family membrane protein
MSNGFEPWRQYTHFVLALIAVLDPFMAMPVFLGLRAGRSEAQHRRLARTAALIVLAVLVSAALGGDAILRVLGTSMGSFRVAGGLVLLLMALAMLHARLDAPTAPAIADPGGDQELATVVPLAIPLLAGPGAISTVMIAAEGKPLLQQGTIIAAIALVCLILWLMLRLAVPISRLLGNTGLNIANRLLGLLLAAIAVESMADGLKQLFPVLGG